MIKHPLVSLKSVCVLKGERFSLFSIPVTHREAINRKGLGEMSDLLQKQGNGRIMVNPADVLRRHLVAALDATERDLYRHEVLIETELSGVAPLARSGFGLDLKPV